jgi:hypothetical protein
VFVPDIILLLLSFLMVINDWNKIRTEYSWCITLYLLRNYFCCNHRRRYVSCLSSCLRACIGFCRVCYCCFHNWRRLKRRKDLPRLKLRRRDQNHFRISRHSSERPSLTNFVVMMILLGRVTILFFFVGWGQLGGYFSWKRTPFSCRKKNRSRLKFAVCD